MDIYVINLLKETERKAYMQSLLSSFQEDNNIQYIEAVEGRKLTDEECNRVFDKVTTRKRYGRELNPGEIGCTLSHFKCYKKLLESKENYVLILEDDITILRDLSYIHRLVSYVDTQRPTILFLSGDYWFYKSKQIDDEYSICSVYDSVGSYAYFINKKAAELILKKNRRASSTADNWSLYRHQGVCLKAVRPYIVDANIESFESTINQTYFGENRRNMPWSMKIEAYKTSFIKKIILKSGGFVSKIRK